MSGRRKPPSAMLASDGRLMSNSYEGARCRDCRKVQPVGEWIRWYGNGNGIRCIPCATPPPPVWNLERREAIEACLKIASPQWHWSDKFRPMDIGHIKRTDESYEAMIHNSYLADGVPDMLKEMMRAKDYKGVLDYIQKLELLA